jgi:hypothetical protein
VGHYGNAAPRARCDRCHLSVARSCGSTSPGSGAEFDLVWSQVLNDGPEGGAFADQKRAEFEARGWIVNAEDSLMEEI